MRTSGELPCPVRWHTLSMSSTSERQSTNVSYVTSYVDSLFHEGQLFMLAVERANLDDTLPTVPEWRVRDLVRHLGGIHRWATAHVSGRRTGMLPKNEEASVMNTWPSNPHDAEGLLEWFREGHRALVDALSNADPELDCWRFLPAASGTSFWARRQAHETAIHRADAELPYGLVTPFAPGHATDGIDEVLRGFFGRSTSTLRSDFPRTLAFVPIDADAGWHVTIRADRVDTTDPNFAEASCTVRATASDLYLLVWNRIDWSELDVQGDDSVLKFWRENAKIEWS